jgi:hypothetical protein
MITSVCAQETEFQYLSGTGEDNTLNWQFFCTAGTNSGKWTIIPVPSNWELQGFGKYNYGFAKDSVRGKEMGLYKYEFSVPAAWKDKKINIVFEGSMTDTEVKVNGQLAGPVHQGAFYAFKYDISRLIKHDGNNLLEVTVAKHSSNASVNEAERKADFWIFGGIFRPVFLEALPATHIEHVAIDAKADGSLTAVLTTAGVAGQVQLELFKPDGSAFGRTVKRNISSSGKTLLRQNFSSPALWSAEFPHLYKAVFSLFINGKLVHRRASKIGFRTVEVRQRDGIYINGTKMKFKGVNRHSFWPTSGRTTSRRISINDVLEMKDMNMNAVRMSHYPPDAHFLDVCDSLGLYVMDELAGWHGHYDTPTGSKLLKEMIQHDANHPSIIIWSNGNEGGHNPELDPLFAEEDIQKRPVVHPWELYGGIETQHYREYNYGIGNYEHGRDILMPTEFLHGMYDGGHGAGLQDYWDAMLKNPLSAGGFLWDFADQGVVRRDRKDSLDTDGNRAADGIVGPYHEKEGSYFAIKEIWSPVYFEPRFITRDFDGELNVENRYDFTNTNQCRFTWTLKSLGDVGLTGLTGSIRAPDLQPSEKGSISIPLPSNWDQFDVLYIAVYGPDKKELFTWSFPITPPANFLKRVFATEQRGKVEVSEQDSIYHVKANNIRLSFNKRNGMLMQVQNSRGVIPFNNGPVLQDAVNNFQNITHHYSGDTLIIRSSFDRISSYNTIEWRVYPSGLIGLQVKYFPAAYFTSFVGLNFSFPETLIKGVTYLGDGPYRVWKNRMKGNRFGVWNKAYNNTETGEAWTYPEFKGYHSNMYWCKFITTTQAFTVYTSDEAIFLRLFTPAFKTDQWHNYEPVFPSGDISFMHGISSIGSKTQRNETTGPMGMKNIFYDYEKDPSRALTVNLYFDFSGN